MFKNVQQYFATLYTIMDELRNAVQTLDVKAAKDILQKNKNIDLNQRIGKKHNYTTLLILACETECTSMVKLLAVNRKYPADVDMPDCEGRYPISVAVQKRSMKLIALLLMEAKANPNVCCGKKHSITTPLNMACEPWVNMDIVKLLTEYKADVNMADNCGRTPIWLAVVTRNIILARYLLSNTAANPDIRVKALKSIGGSSLMCTTPLIEACRKKKLDMVQLLLEHTVPLDVNTADGNGVRPLSVALKSGNMEIVHALLHVSKMKLEVNYAYDINLPVDYVAFHYRPSTDTQNYCTPLTQAVGLGDIKLVGDFIQAGADINAYNFIQQNIIDYTPLMEAVLRGRLDMCIFLIKNGCDVNARSSVNTRSKTALTFAVQGSKPDHLSIAEFLLQHGASHPMEKCGRSLPMYLALLRDKEKLLNSFLTNGYTFKQYPCPQNPAVIKDELCDAIQAYAEDCGIMLIRWGFDVKANTYPYFCEAIGHGMSRLTRILIQQNPQYLQENWLVCNDIPVKCRENPTSTEILRWLEKERMQPRQLQEVCKASILHSISRPHYKISTQINRLELPVSLNKFLQL